MRTVELTRTSRGLLAPVCRDCCWWLQAQHRRRDSVARDAWETAAEEAAGCFGRALLDGDHVIGWMHAAPGHLFAGASALPAGPPSPDAWLLACAYFYDEEYLTGFQRLLQELEADLKRRDAAALEAFCLRRRGNEHRFRGYLREVNLFQTDVLEGSGFRRVARRGDVARYRLDLATLVASPRRTRRWRRVKAPAAAQPV